MMPPPPNFSGMGPGGRTPVPKTAGGQDQAEHPMFSPSTFYSIEQSPGLQPAASTSPVEAASLSASATDALNSSTCISQPSSPADDDDITPRGGKPESAFKNDRPASTTDGEMMIETGSSAVIEEWAQLSSKGQISNVLLGPPGQPEASLAERTLLGHI